MTKSADNNELDLNSDCLVCEVKQPDGFHLRAAKRVENEMVPYGLCSLCLHISDGYDGAKGVFTKAKLAEKIEKKLKALMK